MIHRVRHRRTFEVLRRDGRRLRGSIVSVTYLPMDLPAPQLAFAVPTSFGTAVQRQRALRRCRAAFRAAWTGGRRGPNGVYLVRPGRRSLTAEFGALQTDLERMFETLADA